MKYKECQIYVGMPFIKFYKKGETGNESLPKSILGDIIGWVIRSEYIFEKNVR